MPQQPVEAASPKRTHRAWSLYVGSIAGIPVYLHFTFLLLLMFIGFVQAHSGQAVFGGLALVIAVFASVALHELGHALVARSYGIKTDDIVLYPIGGVARLRSMGEKTQEFWIAVAGPSVNVVIATLIGIYLYFRGQLLLPQSIADEEAILRLTFLQKLMIINIILVIFNLIPAFPMDGGRVLRSLLTLAMSKERATSIAAGVGQALAILFVLVGLLNGQVILMFIGIFVFIAAGQESMATKSQALMSGKRVRDAMITRFEVLNHGDSLGRAADLLLATSQQDFPVMNGTEVLGVLGRKELLQGLASLGRDHYVAQAMTRDFPRISPAEPLEHAFDQMRQADGLPVLVLDGEKLVGYVNNENLMEYLMIQQLGK
ncbi:MAG: site-2 protease family protein [Candidatus Sumerlaeia bacterium]